MIFKRKIMCSDDYYNHPDTMTVDISKEDAERILMLSKEVKRLKIYKIVDFDYSPEFSKSGVDDPDWRMDCVTINITDREFFYRANIKHTNVDVESEGIRIVTLKKRMEKI